MCFVINIAHNPGTTSNEREQAALDLS